MTVHKAEHAKSERPLDTGNVFFIPVGDCFAFPERALYIVYAPLADIAFVASEKQCLEIARQVNAGDGSGASEELVKKLGQGGEVPVWNIPPPEYFEEIEILPNFDCNFRCAYCYAADSRGSKRLSMPRMLGAVDYFFAPGHPAKKIRLSFVGGGEPLLAWSEILKTIEYAESKSSANNRQVSFCFITNGSILSDEMLRVFKSHRVYVRVSFDILPDIQNKQRGCHARVADNINTLVDNGVPVALRAIITPESAARMSEMVTFVKNYFPKVGKVDFEPVSMQFDSVAAAREFYREYTCHFFAAMKTAEAAGINLDSIARRMSATVKSRYCPGDFCITPEGKITICHRIASANDKNYDSFVYGEISEDGAIHMDHAKYYAIQNNKKIGRYSACGSCYAKYNCGGGCLVQRTNSAPWLFEVFCDFTRRFLREYILYVMDRQLREVCGKTLREYISGSMTGSGA